MQVMQPDDPSNPMPDRPPGNVEMLDRICAGLVGLSGLCTGIGVFFISGLFAFFGQTPGSDPEASLIRGFQQFMGVVIAFCLVLGVIEVMIAYGLWRSRRWAFIAAIVFFAVGLLGSLKFAPMAIVSIAVVVYCALRISGNYGPRPT